LHALMAATSAVGARRLWQSGDHYLTAFPPATSGHVTKTAVTPRFLLPLIEGLFVAVAAVWRIT